MSLSNRCFTVGLRLSVIAQLAVISSVDTIYAIRLTEGGKLNEG
jgi:hypothetical protein